MHRFSGHLQDAWGSFVDVKVNLLDMLGKELPRRPPGKIWLSSVCDPYQPLEKKYELSRGVIEIGVGNVRVDYYSVMYNRIRTLISVLGETLSADRPFPVELLSKPFAIE
jgi:hypothetical protein